MRSQQTVVVCVVGAFSLVAAACSGGDTTSPTSQDVAVSTTTGSEETLGSTDPASPPGTSAQDETADSTVTTTQPTTTTTEPPPVIVPAGGHWQPAVPVVEGLKRAAVRTVKEIDGDIWVLVGQYNGARAFRSSDAGVTWTEVVIAGPPSDGSLNFADIDRGPDGRYVVTATLGLRCELYEELEGGYRQIGLCLRHRPILFVSNDGDAWRRVDPPAMAPPGDVSVGIAAMTTTAGGFVAAGTVKGADWHVRLWTSPDGEVWTLDRELRGANGPMSANDVLYGTGSLVVLTEEHPCSTPSIGSPGWYLGAQWGKHRRVFQGPSAADVVLLTPDDHPFVVPPAAVDCATTSGFDVADLSYPSMVGAEIGDDIVVREVPIVDSEANTTDADDDDLVTTRRLAVLSNGSWDVDELVIAETDRFVLGESLLDVSGEVGYVGPVRSRSVLHGLATTLPTAEGYTTVVVPAALIATSVSGFVWVDETLVVVSTLRVEPFATFSSIDTQLGVYSSRSQATTDPTTPCSLEPGGSCRLADLAEVDGYPDFAGADLTGIDLAFSKLGSANFDGAVLAGATLWGVEAEEASFVGADLSSAQAQQASFGDASSASFVGANVSNARIDNATSADFSAAVLEGTDIDVAAGAVFVAADLNRTTLGDPGDANFEGAFFDGTTIEYSSRPTSPIGAMPGVNVKLRYDEEGDEPFELSFAGADLTEMEIHGGYGERRLTVTDLTGSILTGASFYYVDLSGIDPTTVDFTDVDVWENSICPDGLPPDDPPIGTCVRGG